MSRPTRPQPPATGGQPSAAAPSPPYRAPHVPPTTDNGTGWLPSHIIDGIEDARRYGGELERNGASEFSIGKGRVVPWVARRARAQDRYPEPSDGYGTAYRGTSPPCREQRTPVAHERRGSVALHRALRRYG
jgi:hypothetical protein